MSTICSAHRDKCPLDCHITGIKKIDWVALRDLMDSNDWTMGAMDYVEEALRHYETCRYKYSGI